jgi:hypothetical protein
MGGYLIRLRFGEHAEIYRQINPGNTLISRVDRAEQSSEGDQRIIEEISDLDYLSLVLFISRDIKLTLLKEELSRRHMD